MKVIYHLLLAIAIVLSGLSGCSSSDDPDAPSSSEHYFRFRVDGTLVNYPFTPESQINLTGSIVRDNTNMTYVASVAGIDDIFAPGLSNRLTILMSDADNFATGITYSNIPGEGDQVPGIVFNMGYTDGQEDTYIAGINLAGLELYDAAEVTFTEITDDTIAGTFSGNLRLYSYDGGVVELVNSVVITEGTFHVPRY